MASIREQFGLTEGDFDGTAQQERPRVSMDQFARREPQQVTRQRGLGDEFTAGLGQGVDSMQMALYGVARMAGRELGVQSMEEFGQQGIDRNQDQLQTEPQPSIGSLADIESTGDFFKWASGALGQAVPSLGLAMTTGGVGGVMARKAVENGLRRTIMNRTVRNMTGKGFSEDAARAAADRMLRSEQGKKLLFEGLSNGIPRSQLMARAYGRGALSGAVAASAPPQIGSIDMELQEAGVSGGKSALTAILAGTVGGALEALPALKLLDKMFPGVDREVSKAFVKDLAKGMGQQAVLEGSTEGAQEMIAIASLAFHDPTFDPFSDESQQRVIDAFAAGALVGTVTGGAAGAFGEGVTRGKIQSRRVQQRAAAALPKFTLSDELPDDFVPADNTVGQEVAGRVKTALSSIVDPVVNVIRDSAEQALNAVDTEIGGSMTQEATKLSDIVAQAHRDFVTEHKEFFNRITTFAQESTKRIYEQAQSLSDPVAREEFISNQVNKVKEEAQRAVDSILARDAQEAQQRTSRKVDEADMSFDPDEQIFEQRATRYEFGKSNTGGKVENVDLFQPQEGEVEGFKTRKAARNLLDKLRQRFPSASDSTFAIVERDDGTFTVELNDPNDTEALREDDTISRALERARKSARRQQAAARAKDIDAQERRRREKQNQKRQFTVTNEDGTKTTFDWPTLQFAARDLTDVDTDQAAVATMVARMMERGMIDDQQAAQLAERFGRKPRPLPYRSQAELDLDALEPGMQARIRERVRERLADENVTTARDRDVREPQLLEEELGRIDQELEGAVEDTSEQQGEEARFIEEGSTQGFESETEQARRQTSNTGARPTQQQKDTHKMRREFNANKKLKVFMPGVRAEIAEAVHSLAKFIQDNLGMKSQIRIVNKLGAARMVQGNHPHAHHVRDFESSGRGRIVHVRDGDQDVMYVLLDDKGGLASPVILAHELGHALHYETWNALSTEGKQALWDAFAEQTKNVTKSRVRGREQFVQDDKEFKEWMADQLVAWSMRPSSQARNQVEKFFAHIGEQIRKLYEYLRGNERFELNETYRQFVEAVANRAKKTNPGVDRFFANETQNSQFELPGLDMTDIQLTTRPPDVPQGVIDSVLKKYEAQYPTIVRRATLIRNWVYNAYQLALAPADSAVMSIAKRAPAARQLVRIFGREGHGLAKRSQNYHQRVNLLRGQFLNRYNKITEGMSEAGKMALVRKLRSLDQTSNPVTGEKAKAMRQLFDDMHEYMREAGLPVGRINNYYPKTYDRQKLIDNQFEIVQHMQKEYNLDAPEAVRFYFAMIGEAATREQALRELPNDPTGRMSPSFSAMRSRTNQDKFFDKFLDDNLDNTVSNYVNAAVKRTEYNRLLGEPAPAGQTDVEELRRRGAWNARGKLDSILKVAAAQGATQEDLATLKKYVDANLGMLGRDWDANLPGVRTAMASMMAYQNMRVLLFTVFASLPDAVGPAIRTGNVRQAFDTVINNWKEIGSNQSALAEMARTWGIISDEASQHIMTEYVDNHHMPPTLRKWNDAFFKYTGLEAWTNATRKMALAVGRDYIKNQARLVTEGPTEKSRLRAEAALKELGLSKEDVDTWVSRGEPVWGSAGMNENSAIDERVAEGLTQFVDEAIMRPNPAQRPILGSHPGLMLVYHLKGFMYAFYDIVVRRMAHNFRIAETPAQSVAAISPALMMMALTALGLELREMIQYGLSNRTPPTDRMDGWDYTWTLVERTGLLGPSQMAFDFESADEHGSVGLAAVGGPALSQMADIISKPPSQTVPKALPVVGQIPWARDGLRETTPL